MSVCQSDSKMPAISGPISTRLSAWPRVDFQSICNPGKSSIFPDLFRNHHSGPATAGSRSVLHRVRAPVTMIPPSTDQTVAIVGGGISGCLVAAQLLREAREPMKILLFERMTDVGRGV